MEEKTADEIAQIYAHAGHSVTLINAHENYTAYKTANPTDLVTDETKWKEMIQRNVEHLEMIKNFKKSDEKTSIWTTESFTDIDASITKGKTLYS